MKIKRLVLLSVVFICCLTLLPNLGTQLAQNNSDAPRYASLVKRVKVGDKDNYARAAFSFSYGANGEAAQRLTRNNWDLLFGNSPTPDAFDVTMVTDDCSRIKDLGQLSWNDKFDVPVLPAYPRPTSEPSMKAVVGHMYLVHNKDRDTDHYALFRVEKLVPGEKVTISWKLLTRPELR
jgi:hypothetical protein